MPQKKRSLKSLNRKRKQLQKNQKSKNSQKSPQNLATSLTSLTFISTFLLQIEKKIHENVPTSLRAGLGQKLWQSMVLLKKSQIQAKCKKIEVAKGVSISCLELGPASAPILLFLHGFGDIKENFLLAASLLKKDFHVIIPDLPGFGESTKNPRLKYSLSQYRDWVIQLLKVLPAKDKHIMGNSMGGAIAAEVALKTPHLVKSLTLINSAGIITEDSLPFYLEVISPESPFVFQDHEGLIKLLDRIFYSRPYVPLLILDYVAKLFTQEMRWYQKIINDMVYKEKEAFFTKNAPIDELGLNLRIGQITTPTLILWGDKDQFFPLEVGKYFHREIKNSILKILSNIGHSPQIECPLATTRIFTQFVQDVNNPVSAKGKLNAKTRIEEEEEEELKAPSPWAYLFGNF